MAKHATGRDLPAVQPDERIEAVPADLIAGPTGAL